MWFVKLVTKILEFLKPKMPSFIKRAFLEDDGIRVSSSRIMGALTFGVLHLCNVVLIGAISWSLIKVIQTHPIDNMALISLLGSIKYLSLLYLILAATALALYGVNVWKYLNEIKNGVSYSADALEKDVEKDTEKGPVVKPQDPVKKPEQQVPDKTTKPTPGDL
jgi:hypothetical protein